MILGLGLGYHVLPFLREGRPVWVVEPSAAVARLDLEAVKIFNASRINLNLHSSPYHLGINPEGDYVNPRTFDLAAAGPFNW